MQDRRDPRRRNLGRRRSLFGDDDELLTKVEASIIHFCERQWFLC